MGTMANSEDLGEILHKAAFHEGLHCLLKHIDLQRNKILKNWEIITCNPSIYTQRTILA